MKSKFNKLNIILLLSLFLMLISCTTKKYTHKYINYSDKSSVLYEIKKIETLLEENKTFEALTRAEILKINIKDNKQIDIIRNKAIKQINEEFNSIIKEKKWLKSIKYFRSLVAVNQKPKEWTEEKIIQAQYQIWKNKNKTALLQSQDSIISENNKYPTSFEQMLKGTVTVIVDKGTKIEKGLGFSNIVIGSGFFIDEDGYFITNYHVIQSEVDPKYEGYSKLYIKSPLNPHIKISAKVIGWDPIFDLALVKTEIKPETIFPLGSSKKLKIGSKIFAIGSPAGLEKTLTSGIVSTKYRRLFSVVDVMQIDAPINHGNSGGPIVDKDGKVQGIVFAGLEQNEGLNFAIPVELLKSILPELYHGKKIEHSWIGAYGNPKKINDDITGVEAAYILPNSPLSIANMEEGSIITHFNGIKVTTTEELQTQILSISTNTISRLKGFEKNNLGKFIPKEWVILSKKRPILPGKKILEQDTIARAMLPIFGLHLKNSGKRKSYRIKKVEPGSFADESGFTINDYIELNGISKHKDQDHIINAHIYAKKIKAGYIDSFMIISAYLDNPNFF